ncbi:MAG: DNRLRE domain-containing protein [Phycisphaerae bacterium]
MNRHITWVVCAAIVWAGWATGRAGATTITLKQGVNGYAGCTDTYIDADNPNTNYGEQWYMHLYMSNHNPKRSDLVKFDLAGQIPAGQTIVSATLGLWVYQIVDMTSGDWADVAPYRVRGTRGWVENQATWNVFKGSTYWATAGCENTSFDRYGAYDGTAIRFTKDSPVNCYYTWDVTSSVQTWYAGSEANNGWLVRIVAHDGGTDGLSMNTSESSSASYRPYLTITYVPEPATVSLLALGGTGLLARCGRRARGCRRRQSTSEPNGFPLVRQRRFR